ncbi:MAG TPA: hypothetical protein VK846_11305 [Candidatus Limnocylindria bacterium]|nr:hypothetical protein [Candidatus Limnocylindria bacterium]
MDLQQGRQLFMTMAPNRKKRGFWLEVAFIGILLFLLMGSRSQSGGQSAKGNSLFKNPASMSLGVQPVALK